MARCVYCKGEITDERAVDVCDSCGRGVWGEKMFRVVIDGMSNAREKGDLMQGSINVEVDKRARNQLRL